MVRVKMPASCANMGPGFDCIGMALQLYNVIEVGFCDTSSKIPFIESIDGVKVPLNGENLIYRSLIRFYDETNTPRNFENIRIRQIENAIPIAKGFGSSAACIVGGVLAANQLSGLRMSRLDVLDIAAKIEGHIDNVAPALFGGIVLGFMNRADEAATPHIEKFNVHPLLEKGLKFGAITPSFRLPTAEARYVLPKEYSDEIVRFNTSHAVLLGAAIAGANIEQLGMAMKDKVHQPFRAKIIVGYHDVMQTVQKHSPVGAFLSGAGPTIFVLYKDNQFKEKIETDLAHIPDDWKFRTLVPDFEGATIEAI